MMRNKIELVRCIAALAHNGAGAETPVARRQAPEKRDFDACVFLAGDTQFRISLFRLLWFLFVLCSHLQTGEV